MTPLEKLYNIKFVKRHLAKTLFALKRRPSVAHKEKNYALAKPTVVISADFELAWGWRYSKNGEDPFVMAKRTRTNFPRLIEIFERYDVPITWAVVGHLLLRSCTSSSHRWMRRVPYFENRNWIFDRGNWFDADPHTHWRNAEAWYAPDLIERILNSKVRHEIGCHTFSHADFSYQRCPCEVAEDEVKACLDAAKPWGIDLKSFVFAGGTYGNYEIVKKYGFAAYRKTLRHEISYPYIDSNGLVVVPASICLANNELGWSLEYIKERYNRYIQSAVNNGAICHFWFHPSFDHVFAESVFPSLLRYISELREKNIVEIRTIGDIAQRMASMSSEF
jgi:peptidoglycan/xylan/chitin deacetylase (PgdA/CDA1 family)